MVDVVHTADVHLAPDAPERLEALGRVLDVAADLDAEAVTIGGDLFDRPRDVEALRPRLRNDLFADRDLEVILIPGNHDVEAFRDDTFFGEACRPVLEEPFGQVDLPGVDLRVTAVPYTDRVTDELLLALAERPAVDGQEALLLHCTLDVGFGFEETGGEDTARYFPVTPDQLAELGFEYVLAGHHHGAKSVAVNGSTFVYPGTPASTRRSETGPRRAVTVDTAGQRVDFVELETYHRVSTVERVLPGGEDELFGTVRTWVDRNVGENADAEVVVDGFHELDEGTFHGRLTEAAGPAAVEDRTVNVRRFRAHPVYRAFESKLASAGLDGPMADAVRRRTLEAFIELGADR